VTGLGAVSSLGIGVGPFWAGLCQGQPQARKRSALAACGLGELPVALTLLPEDGPLADDGRALLADAPRVRQLAAHAAAEALQSGGWPGGATSQLGLVVGTTNGEKGPWLAGLKRLMADGSATAFAAGPTAYGCAAPARWLAAHYAASPVRVISSACASGNAAIGTALGWIRSGHCEAVLCGGVDALQPFVLSGFLALRAHSAEPARPFDAQRSGLNLGEGAAFVLLESAAHAAQRGQPIRAYLDGSGVSSDAHHMTGPDREGRGATRAMRAALADAGLLPSSLDFVSAHGTATAFNDLMEGKALAALFGSETPTVPVNSIKGAIGHCLGAAGALEAVMAVRVLEAQLIPPTAGLLQLDPAIPLRLVSGSGLPTVVRHLLSTSSGFGGINAALVFSRADSEAGGAQR
jgi:3-oxoacyl-[acyl-carrier-protein] synthase II